MHYQPIMDALYDLFDPVFTCSVYKGRRLVTDDLEQLQILKDTSGSFDKLNAWFIYRDSVPAVDVVFNPRYDESQTWVLEGIMSFDDASNRDTETLFQQEIDAAIEALEDNYAGGHKVLVSDTNYHARCIMPVRCPMITLTYLGGQSMVWHTKIFFPIVERNIPNT